MKQRQEPDAHIKKYKKRKYYKKIEKIKILFCFSLTCWTEMQYRMHEYA